MQLMQLKTGGVMDLREIYAKRLDREEDNPILIPDQWYPHFRDFHHKVIAENPNFDFLWLKEHRPGLCQALKAKENALDCLRNARLSEIMAIMREWRELVLKAESEQRRANKAKAEGTDKDGYLFWHPFYCVTAWLPFPTKRHKPA